MTNTNENSFEMRIAVFTNQFPSRVSTFFARDMRGLLETGIEIDIFPMYPEEQRLWDYVPNILSNNVLPRAKVHHLTLGQSVRSMGLRPLHLRELSGFLRDSAAIAFSAARSGIEPLAKSAYVLPKAWAWAQRYLSSCDHVLAYWGNYAATCAYVFHRLANRPMPFSMFLHAGIDLYDNRVFLREKLLYADNIIVPCDFNRQFLRDNYSDIFHLISEKIHVHHLGLDLAETPYDPVRRAQRRIVAVGRFDRPKGFDYLIRAVRELTIRGLEVDLELVGDGDEADSLRKLADALGLTNRVRFRGWLTYDEVQVAIGGATVLAHPSTRLYDAVPTVIKEAMALGTPVVASDVAGIPELLDGGRCGVLVPPMEVRPLADALETLFADDSLRRNYALTARRFAEKNFDLWKNGKRLAGILCSSRRGGSCRRNL